MMKELKEMAGTILLFLGFLVFLLVMSEGPKALDWAQQRVDSYLGSQ